MCQRESFILTPLKDRLPVAWSVSYHHEVIGMNVRNMLHGAGLHWDSPFIQIECAGGEVARWDWDNTPIRRVQRPVYKSVMFTPDGYLSPQNVSAIEIMETKEPDLPYWLEDNLMYYQDKVARILDRLNPWRDRQEFLQRNIFSQYYADFPVYVSRPIEANLAALPADSPEVREFEAIVNGYREIDGFVYNTPEPYAPFVMGGNGLVSKGAVYYYVKNATKVCAPPTTP